MLKNKILLVDDEKDIRDVMHLSLADMGYAVFEAQNGAEALAVFREVQPQVVLTDIKMPTMDGIELLQKVKHENPETEVVMITGHGDMDLAIKSLKYEATDFITKPINVDVLEIALKRAFDKIITRRKLREYTENLERLVREKTELQSHLSSLGLMIGSISHAIKGLLTGLDGGMYLLDSGFVKENQAQIKEGWEVVKLMIARIRKMILDILFYAKERDLKWERIDALSFADEVALVMEPRAKSQEIEFVRDFDLSVGEFEIDAGYVHSALINILENAVDACTRDESKKSHKIVLGVRQKEKHIAFDIFDNGIGMDSETKERLFTPFFSSKANKGTGLGLFISNKIIEQHRGEIIVKSTPGQGTLFTIRIPTMLPESAKRRPPKNMAEKP
ncbi:MAG: hybrid sensor histidine kinase/response regulator [Desulfobacterales bacterium]|nr:MAG: hybrid sensor histidine kinase/response regulator [Desulfobacterales bacterium]